MTAILDPPKVRGIVRKCQDGLIELRWWCSYCKRYHLHGLGTGSIEGYRPGDVVGHWVSHCTNPQSPYYGGGYEIEIEGVEK